MFLRTNRSQTGYAGTEQRAGGPFLAVFSWALTEEHKFTGKDGKRYPKLRAVVRSVRMHQFGHWMMGSMELGPIDPGPAMGGGPRRISITLSGTYGSDGLTCDPERYPGLWETLMEVPDDLAEQFWNGGGWNSAGKEGPSMRAWAVEHERELRRAGTERGKR